MLLTSKLEVFEIVTSLTKHVHDNNQNIIKGIHYKFEVLWAHTTPNFMTTTKVSNYNGLSPFIFLAITFVYTRQ